MTNATDPIPVLTDFVDDETVIAPASGETERLLGELEAQLTAAINEHTDELVHNACRDLEALLLEHVSDRLRADLPALVATVIDEHFRGSRRPN